MGKPVLYKNLETTKYELEFDRADYMALSDDDKKQVRSYFRWSKFVGRWVSKGKNYPWTSKDVADKLGATDGGEEGESISFAEEQKRKAERMERRADRLEDRADKKAVKGKSMQQDRLRHRGDINFWTQPIYNTARGRSFQKYRDRIWDKYFKGIGLEQESRRLKGLADNLRSEASGSKLKNPVYLDNRIKENEADIRRYERLIGEYSDDENLKTQLRRSLEKLAYYQQALDDIGGFKFNPENVKGATHLRFRYKKIYPIKRINKKTVTISHWHDIPTAEWKVPYSEIQEIFTLEEEKKAVANPEGIDIQIGDKLIRNRKITKSVLQSLKNPRKFQEGVNARITPIAAKDWSLDDTLKRWKDRSGWMKYMGKGVYRIFFYWHSGVEFDSVWSKYETPPSTAPKVPKAAKPTPKEKGDSATSKPSNLQKSRLPTTPPTPNKNSMKSTNPTTKKSHAISRKNSTKTEKIALKSLENKLKESPQKAKTPTRLSVVRNFNRDYKNPQRTTGEKTLKGFENAPVYLVPLSAIKVDLAMFQNRSTAYSSRTVESITSDAKSGKFRMEVLDPILLYQTVNKKQLFVLAGHSRLEGFKRSKVKNYKDATKKYDFSRIPAKILDGSKVSIEMAMAIARNSNQLATPETQLERVLYYRKLLKNGFSRQDVGKEIRKHEARNASRIAAYTYLNPRGKAIATLKALEEGEAVNSAIATNIVYFVGASRKKYPELTNLHEKEMFDYLNNGGYGDGKGKVKRLTEWLQKVKTLMIKNQNKKGDFVTTKPLNFKRLQSKSFAEAEFEKELKLVTNALNDAERKRKSKALAILKKQAENRKKGVKIGVKKEDAEFQRIMKPFYRNINGAARKVRNLLVKRPTVLKASTKEATLFM